MPNRHPLHSPGRWRYVTAKGDSGIRPAASRKALAGRIGPFEGGVVSDSERTLQLPANALRLLAQLRDLGPEPEPQRQIDVLRRLIPLISRDTHRQLWLALQG